MAEDEASGAAVEGEEGGAQFASAPGITETKIEGEEGVLSWTTSRICFVCTIIRSLTFCLSYPLSHRQAAPAAGAAADSWSGVGSLAEAVLAAAAGAAVVAFAEQLLLQLQEKEAVVSAAAAVSFRD